MTNFVKSHYRGGHRVLLGGVPCKVSYLPRHEGGRELMRQSSREMGPSHPPRNRKDLAKWEADQRRKYAEAEKLGDRSIADVVTMPAVEAVERVEALAVTVEPVGPVERPVRSVEPFARRLPVRPVTRRLSGVMAGTMRTIHYYRVSTAKQGRSGLGLEAQRAAVEAFCAGRGCDMVAEYVEVESGKNDRRPELAAALHHAKVTGATLVIAKLDRLSRNVAFLAQLQDGGVKFMCADMPQANELTLHIMAAMAQAERKAISDRTKAAMAAAKARGTKFGNPLGAAAWGDQTKGTVAGVASIKAKADGFAADVLPIVAAIQAEGFTSLSAIARELNARGIMTARGGQWAPQTVANLLSRG